MSDELLNYRVEQLHTQQGEIKTILSTHVDEDHELQSEINSSLQVMKHQIASIQHDVQKLSAKASSTWDYIQRALGGLGLIGILLAMANYSWLQCK